MKKIILSTLIFGALSLTTLAVSAQNKQDKEKNANDKARTERDNASHARDKGDVKEAEKFADSAKKAAKDTPNKDAKSQKVPEPNFLKEGYVALGAPITGQGKNNNDSHLDIYLTLKTTDGNQYKARGNVRENSEIFPSAVIKQPLYFDTGLSSVTPENLDEVILNIDFIKPDYLANFREDTWNARAEVVLTFKDNTILATGGNDPAIELSFQGYKRHWHVFTVKKTNMSPAPRMVPPIN